MIYVCDASVYQEQCFSLAREMARVAERHMAKGDYRYARRVRSCAKRLYREGVAA